MSLRNSKETSVIGAERARGEWWEVRAGGDRGRLCGGSCGPQRRFWLLR